jgi:hypothetical protein
VKNSSRDGWKSKRITRQNGHSHAGGQKQWSQGANASRGMLPVEIVKQRRLARGIDHPLHSQQVANLNHCQPFPPPHPPAAQPLRPIAPLAASGNQPKSMLI